MKQHLTKKYKYNFDLCRWEYQPEQIIFTPSYLQIITDKELYEATPNNRR